MIRTSIIYILYNIKSKSYEWNNKKCQTEKIISIHTMCLNPYPEIYLPHEKFVCRHFKDFLTLYLSLKEKILSKNISYIKYNF